MGFGGGLGRFYGSSSFLFIDFEDPQLFSPQGPVQLFPGMENCLGIMSDAGGPEV